MNKLISFASFMSDFDITKILLSNTRLIDI